MEHQKKKDFLLLATKLIEQISHASNAKEYYNSLVKITHKIDETIKNNYTATTNYSKPKQCSHKISYHRTSKNFT